MDKKDDKTLVDIATMSGRVPPSPAQVRDLRKHVAEPWSKGLNSEVWRALSSHDLDALAAQIGWYILNDMETASALWKPEK